MDNHPGPLHSTRIPKHCSEPSSALENPSYVRALYHKPRREIIFGILFWGGDFRPVTCIPSSGTHLCSNTRVSCYLGRGCFNKPINIQLAQPPCQSCEEHGCLSQRLAPGQRAPYTAVPARFLRKPPQTLEGIRKLFEDRNKTRHPSSQLQLQASLA